MDRWRFGWDYDTDETSNPMAIANKATLEEAKKVALPSLPS